MKKCEWRLTREKTKVNRRQKDGTMKKVAKTVYKNSKGERRVKKLTKSRGKTTVSYVKFKSVK